MKYIEWAKQNPTKTREYLRLLNAVACDKEEIQKYNDEIKDIMSPGWFDRHESERELAGSNSLLPILPVLPDFVSLFSQSLLDIPEEQSREYDIDRWEKQAVEAAKKKAEQEKIAIQVYSESARDMAMRYRGYLDKSLEELKNYVVADEPLRWFSDEVEDKALSDAINNRITSLKQEWDYGYEFNGDIIRVIGDLSVLLNVDITVKFDNKRDRWIISISDGIYSFTRSGFFFTDVFLITILKYFDHRWDYLITKFEKER